MKSETTVDSAFDKCLDDDHIAEHMPCDVQRTAALSNIGVSSHHTDDIDPSNVASHPGLLALARVLGGHAARADLRRVRRGAVPVMALTDWLLITAAVLVGALIWSIMAGLR